MALTAKERRELLTQGHALKAVVAISADALTDSVVAHVRTSFGSQRLVKLRIHAESGDACDAAAAEIAQRVPCEIVKRIGRVVLLYRAEPTASPE